MTEVDVCIVGSGPAGLALARRLAEKDVTVVILERGGAVPALNTNDDSVTLINKIYNGATAGRAIGFGGTSAYWGGQLLPLHEEEILRDSGGECVWPISYRELAQHYNDLEGWLGVDALNFFDEFMQETGHPARNLDWGALKPRFSKWIPFGLRNLGTAWKAVFNNTPNIRVYLGSTLTGVDFTGGRHGVCLAGTTTTSCQAPYIRANYYVIAAGAIESPCVLQKIVYKTSDAACRNDNIGCYLHDHVSMRVGRIHFRDRKQFNRLFAPCFNGKTMHSMRIEIDPRQHDYKNIPPGYCHFVSEARVDSGFAVVKDALLALQSRSGSKFVRQLRKVPMVIPGILEIARWRYLFKRLPYVTDSDTYLQVDLEQPPSRSNRVFATDPANFLSSGINIDWDLRFDVAKALAPYRHEFDEFWKRNGLGDIAEIEHYSLSTDPDTLLTNLYDIYHPAGTTRMATTAVDGVVNSDLRVFGFDNLYVLSTSVFPSLGAANPTFSLMALALRLAKHIHDATVKPVVDGPN